MMALSEIWGFLEAWVFPLHGTETGEHPAFNPYQDINSQADKADAAQIRRTNLKNYLDSFTKKPEILIIGEAPGWRGCRFSGVPFTSEAQLIEGTLAFSGSQSSSNRIPYREATATIFWNTMHTFSSDFLVWNCMPIHPHQVDNKLSNRTPSNKELCKFHPIISQLVKTLSPVTIVAVGKRAQRVMSDLGIEAIAVRHPSHGGAQEFNRGIQSIFEESHQNDQLSP